MIKYFSFEEHYDDINCIIKNEKVLYEKPDTPNDGWILDMDDKIHTNIIDVEKFIDYYGVLDDKHIYDKLLIEQRNKKLETL